MSITIGSLKYQDTKRFLSTYVRDSYNWLNNYQILSGVKGKAVINALSIDTNLLALASCVTSLKDSSLKAKEVELEEFNATFPISDCELKRTWLSAFANDMVDEDDIYINQLTPHLIKMMSTEVQDKVMEKIFFETTTDADVSKITLTGSISTPALADSLLVEFISQLPTPIIDEACDRDIYGQYIIYVSPEAYLQMQLHRDLTRDSYGINVAGFNVRGNRALDGTEMLCTRDSNLQFVVDDANDLDNVKIIRKPELSTNYIQVAMAFRGSYIDGEKVAVAY